MRWPWSRSNRGPSEAAAALEEQRKVFDEVVDQWHPILEVVEDHRALRDRNHFRDRAYYALAGQPMPTARLVKFNRRKDDPR